jgi:hypothetical protein
MTFIVGANLGDGVGLVGDTRVTTRYQDGTLTYFDDCQKIYPLPTLMAGVAGDLLAAHRVLERLINGFLRELNEDDALDCSGDLHCLIAALRRAHEQAVSSEPYLRGRRFGFVLASEDYRAFRNTGKTIDREVQPKFDPQVLDRSFRTRAKFLSRPNVKAGTRYLVFSVRFPDVLERC